MKTLVPVFTLSALLLSCCTCAAVTSDYWQTYINTRATNSDLRSALDTTAEQLVLPNFSYAGYQFANQALPAGLSGTGYGADIPEFDPQLSSHKIFAVTSYGAIANDSNSDKQAIKNTIAAAESYIAAGGDGAIVYFPAGRFLVNEDSDMQFINADAELVSIGFCDNQSVPCIGSTTTPGDETLRQNAALAQPFIIRSSNIIVRGAGSGENGTELYMKNHFVAPYYNIMYNTPHLFMFGQIAQDYWKSSAGADKSTAYMALHQMKAQPSSTGAGAVITRITSSSKRETSRSVTVADVSALYVGQWVRLHSIDSRTEAIAAAMGPYQPEPLFSKTGIPWWTGLNRGFEQLQINQITAIDPDSHTVTFVAPLSADIAASSATDNYGWVLEVLEYTENVGIEDLAIVGEAPAAFVHHKNYVHDSGWSGIYMYKTVNSWLRNVRFTSMSEGVQTILSAAMTLQDIQVDGNPGHLSVAIENSSSILGLTITEQSSTWHAAGFSSFAAGNVILNHSYPATTSPNLHANFPRANLFDGQTGGWVHGHWGGDLGVTPNHMQHLVWWNPVNTAPAETNWEFMQSDSKYGRIIMPYVIGMTGQVHSFASQARYYQNQLNTHYSKTNSTTGDGKDYLVGFTESHANCYEIAELDEDSRCDLPSTVEDATTAITYTELNGDADFPALTNPYSSALPEDALQAYVESAGEKVAPLSLYEAQLTQRQGQLPQWLVDATGKVRYVKLSVLSVQDNNATAVSGQLRLYDLLGQLILSQQIQTTEAPAAVTVDLAGYYNLSNIEFVPDPTSVGLIKDFALHSNKLDLATADWGQALASGSMSNSYYIQRFDLLNSAALLLSVLDSAQNQIESLTDGDASTYWQSSATGDQLYIDMQRQVWLDGLLLTFFNSTGNSQRFDLAYSADNSNWTEISSPTNSADDFISSGSAAAERFALSTPIKARFLRLTPQLSTQSASNFALAEIGVSEQQEPGLISHLPLNENQGTDLIDSTALQSPKLLNALRRNGLIFDGINDYVTLGDIDASSDGLLTIALWAKIDSQTGTAFLLRKHSWGSANPFYIQVTSAGVLSARVNGNGVSVAAMADNQWHHLAITLNQTQLTFYIDGVSVGSTTVSPVSNDTSVSLGTDATGRYPFKGALDDVRFYQQVLTPAQIAALAKQPQISAQRGSCGSDDPAMAAFFPFEDAQVTTPSQSSTSCDATGKLAAAQLFNDVSWGEPVNPSWQGEIAGLSFDGVDDYLQLSDIDYGTDNSLTLALWTRFTNQTDTAFLLRKGNYGSNNPYYIQVNSNGTLLARVNGVGPSVPNLNDNQWHHLAMVLENNLLSLYVDGTFYSQTTVTPVSNNTAVTLGGDSTGSKPFAGDIDDLYIFQRALTADEVNGLATAARFNPAGACEVSNQTQLALHLPLQDGSTLSCDISGLGRSATLVNGPQWLYQSSWLQLDGADDQISVGDIGYGPGHELSASFWFRATTPAEVSYLLQKAQWIGDSPYAIYLRTDGALRAGINGTETEQKALADGNWHHVVTVLQGSEFKLYVDGALADTTVVSPATDQGTLTLGGTASNPQLRPYRGDIDEIRLYQQALTESKVQQLYQSGR